MQLQLGINTGFAVNRMPGHGEWIRFVGEELGLRYVQLTADMLNPSLPADIVQRHTQDILQNLERYSVRVHSTFTGAYTRLNHLAHPDPGIRRHWIDWFARFADLSAALGAEAMGSHFGILGMQDYNDPQRREERTRQNIAGWKEVARHAREAGLKYLLWEPMSIGREYGETLAEAERIQEMVNEEIDLPMKMCLDVDHGDVASSNPDDTDPYAWLRRFGAVSPAVHLKQSSNDKGGHWPFTPRHNARGRISPERVIAALKEAGADKTMLLFEFSFRERTTYERTMLQDIRDSVEYWRPHVGGD